MIGKNRRLITNYIKCSPSKVQVFVNVAEQPPKLRNVASKYKVEHIVEALYFEQRFKTEEVNLQHSQKLAHGFATKCLLNTGRHQIHFKC